MSDQTNCFDDLQSLASYLRERLNEKKYILLFAYNGTGKTRLSMAFKNQGKHGDSPDTLYFNAFTEDLFFWDNDLENDEQRVLKLNRDSRFFDGLQELEMENRIAPLLHRYADFDFFIDYDAGAVRFDREVVTAGGTEAQEHIKVSRGEENIFVWCFFLAVAQLAIDGQEAYDWVKYIYVDDPVSSLDDNHAIAVACHLAELLKSPGHKIRVVVSSHHHLFFNVMCNVLRKPCQYFMSRDAGQFILKNTDSTPRFHHVALLKELHAVAQSGEIYTWHFNMLRNILERTATFHGFEHYSDCLKQSVGDSDGRLHKRLLDLLSHGNYSLYNPKEMLPENKDYFRTILRNFMTNYRFNPELFPEADDENGTP